MSKVIKVIFTLFNLQGTLCIALSDPFILAHFPPFVKHYFSFFEVFLFHSKTSENEPFLNKFHRFVFCFVSGSLKRSDILSRQPLFVITFFHLFIKFLKKIQGLFRGPVIYHITECPQSDHILRHFSYIPQRRRRRYPHRGRRRRYDPTGSSASEPLLCAWVSWGTA